MNLEKRTFHFHRQLCSSETVFEQSIVFKERSCKEDRLKKTVVSSPTGCTRSYSVILHELSFDFAKIHPRRTGGVSSKARIGPINDKLGTCIAY